MKNFKILIEKRLKADSNAIPDTNAVKNESAEQKTVEPSTSFQSADVADDVPIYTATSKEINYWHAYVNLYISRFLSRYDFDMESAAFDSFKIGVDTEKHAVTFALDETHYFKFDLNDTNDRPLDKKQAEKVLRKANAMRFEKNQAYCLKVWKW